MKRWLALLVLVAATSCKDKAATPAPQTSAPEAAKPAAGARDAGSKDAGTGRLSFVPASASDTERVKILVDAWLASQNQGDFAAYQALYAKGFTGIRRSGERVVPLDRDGWFKDRGRMFKKPMVVTIDKLTVVERKGQLSALFTQTWQSGSYKDVGRKWLRLTIEGDELLIEREEMLESTLLDPSRGPDKAVAARRAAAGEVELGFSDHGGLYLAPIVGGQAVLGRVSAPIGKGPITVVDHTIDAASGTLMGLVAEQAIDPGKLPAELAGYTTAVLQILDSELSPSCTARVTGLNLGLADWVIDDSAGEPIDVATAMMADSALIIADLSLPKGCDAHFVRDPGLPPVTGPAPLADDHAITELLRDEAGEPDDESMEIETGFIPVAGAANRAIGQVSRHVPDSCETQESFTTTLYRLEREGGDWNIAGELASYDEEDSLVTAADFDGDGSIEVVTERSVITADGTRDAWNPDLRVFWPAGLGCDGYDGE